MSEDSGKKLSNTEASSIRKTNWPDSGLSELEQEFLDRLSGGKGRKYARLILAALGSIPWVGGVISGLVSFSGEKDQEKVNDLQKLWLREHSTKINLLAKTLSEIIFNLENLGATISERLESEEYLSLVRSGFRSWDQADSIEKKEMIKKLLSNAGAINLCPDDLIRLFIKWIDQYHEAHFVVIREIYRNPGITRGEIWDRIYNHRPKDNSAEADLYKYLISDLSLGHVIRQEREVNSQGQFIKDPAAKNRNRNKNTAIITSAFEDEKRYFLTELGMQFVHYVMKDVAKQIENRK